MDQLLLQRLELAFLAAVAELQDRSRVIQAPIDVVLSEATALQPDLVLVLDRNVDILKDVVRGIPDLVVEVISPASASLDRRLQLETYARHGVGEYWLVDDQAKTVEIHRRDPDAGRYRLVATCRPGDQAATPLVPALAVAVTDLFSA